MNLISLFLKCLFNVDRNVMRRLDSVTVVADINALLEILRPEDEVFSF